MEAAIITTYRCTNKCYMCHTWKYPTQPGVEFKPVLLEKLPALSFANVTGGEPFLREDIDEIVHILQKKAKRVVISTNGYLTGQILRIAEKYPRVGIRISIEGLPEINDQLRGVEHGFDHGLRTLLELHRRGMKDIGFGITVSDGNARDMLELFQLAKAMNVEFATAVVHNSYYFHKQDNVLQYPDQVIGYFVELINELLRSGRAKNWFRAYFNYGLINYIENKQRLLPCGAGKDMFFLDPWGEIRPCNGLDEHTGDLSMGNLNNASFEEIWEGVKAQEIRKILENCPKNCWMIGTASPAMKKNIIKPLLWVMRNKIKSIFGRPFTSA
jgi:radical SAM protein with 4Fe4S-binding SPASM domain